MILAAREQGMRGRKQLQRALASCLLVAATQPVELFPERWLYDRQRDFAACNHRFERAGRAAVFKAARRVLLGESLGSFDEGVLWLMHVHPTSDREHVDSFFRLDAGDRDIDRIDELWRRAVLDGDDGQSAVDSRVDARDDHDS